MKTDAIVPAEIRFDGPDPEGAPYAPAYGDHYHSRAGARGQAEHVFLAGNGLPGRWCQRERFTVLETGFGLGHNFLATWAAWQADPQRPRQLIYLAVDQHPPRPDDLARAHQASPWPTLATVLQSAWPPATPDLHTLDLDGGAVRLLLAWGPAERWLQEFITKADACYLDGFAPDRNPDMWQPRLFRSLARLAAHDGTAATWSVARPVRDGLAAAGFEVQRGSGFAGKLHMCQARRVSPPMTAAEQQGPVGRRPAQRARSALVIGAGLAGAAAARALARDGVAVTVLERHPQPAAETSGNLAGLFHGVVHAQDAAHAQWLRAASLRAAQVYAPSVADGRLPGQLQGLLRGLGPQALAQARLLLQQQGLPAEVALALDAAAARQQAGMPMAQPAWLLGPAGWVSPAALVPLWLEQSGADLRLGQAVARLQPVAPTPSAGGWVALDAAGQPLAQTDVVVLANAHDLPRLLAEWTDVAEWPLRRTRGQVTHVPAATCERLGAPRPLRPVASGGYVLSLPEALGGGLLCGATQQADDDGPDLRPADHRHNLAQVARLSGIDLTLAEADLATLGGRVGWRLACDDRLPVLGGVPLPAAARQHLLRQEQPRQVPRMPGLYVLSALGSRGLTLAPLLGEVLSAWITGATVPVASSLLDAVDVARFTARRARRQPPGPGRHDGPASATDPVTDSAPDLERAPAPDGGPD